MFVPLARVVSMYKAGPVVEGFWPIKVSCGWVTVAGQVVRGRNRWPEGPGGWAKSLGRRSGPQRAPRRSDWGGRRCCSECSRSPPAGFRKQESRGYSEGRKEECSAGKSACERPRISLIEHETVTDSSKGQNGATAHPSNVHAFLNLLNLSF